MERFQSINPSFLKFYFETAYREYYIQWFLEQMYTLAIYKISV